MSEPKIYTRNYIDSDCIVSASHGPLLAARAFDADKYSQWITSGANSDSTEAVYEVDFFQSGIAQSRTIDRICVINHNLKAPTFEQWTGSAWAAITGTPTNPLPASSTIFVFNAPLTTTRIRVRCSTTQVANQEKAIGEIAACLLQIDPLKDFTSYKPSPKQTVREINLANGGFRRIIRRASPVRSMKYSADVEFQFLPIAMLESFLSLKESAAAFLWQPEMTTRPDELYFVHWTGDFDYEYVGTPKPAGFRLRMKLREV